MGANNLTVVGAGKILIAHVNQFFTALAGDFLPRNSATGALEDNVRKLGRPAFRWKELHVTDLFLGGSLFDPAAVGADTKFAINTGATRTDSGQPDFLRADGTGASAKILATTVDFQITANNVSVTISADIALTALTVAPGANNTALVNDTELAGGNETKFTGEDIGDPIAIDAVGSEISDRIGEYICLKTPTGEFMFAFVEDATTLSRCFRGFFFDDTGTPVIRGVLSNNNTLTIMSLGWVFLDNNGTTVDVSYTSPIYSGVEPSSPVSDDYWFDLKNRLWKRFNGSSFQQVDRMLIGLLVIDTTNCVAARSFDFTKSYDDFVDLSIEIESVTEVKTQKGYSRLSVYGQTQELYAGEFIWDITTDLETGVSEAASTTYFLYVTEEGIPVISDEKPFNRASELKGLYHPYHTWRNVGSVFNNSSSDFISTKSLTPFPAKFSRFEDFEASGTFLISQFDIINDEVRVEVWGAGGGGGRQGATDGGVGAASGGYASGLVDLTGVSSVTVTVGAGGAGRTGSSGAGGTGGTSSFGTDVVATGGQGGPQASTFATNADIVANQNPGEGTAGEIMIVGAYGEDSGGNLSLGGLGFGRSFGNGGNPTTSVGEGGTSRGSANNGADGFRGLVRVWY